MNTLANRRIVLAARPQGAPQCSDFSMISEPVPDLHDGEIFSRTIYLSLDPYMRGRMMRVNRTPHQWELARPCVVAQ